MEIRHLKKCVIFLLVVSFSTTFVVGHPVQQTDKKRLNRNVRSIMDSSEEHAERSMIRESLIKMLHNIFSGNEVTDTQIAAMLKSFKSGFNQPDEDVTLGQFIAKNVQLPKLQPTVDDTTKADDDDYNISTVVRTWSKNDSRQGINDVISGYKTEVNKTKRAGRLSINGALTSLADLLLSENQRRDRMETMELRQRLQFLG